jgi:L,D-peptidoglycan transpeptidase YkuD (ErfK/YbiS/YcfS/YnhG family)
MDLVLDGDGCAAWGAHVFRAAQGGGGLARAKREGDRATPVGQFLMREVLYRPDRVSVPRTRLPFRSLAPQDGWCDDPADARYNRRVRLPYPAHAESLWREDHLYDLIVPLGYNDDPVVPGLGSAIFLHVARPDFATTEGCVALDIDDLLSVLEEADATSRVVVRD